MQAAQSGITYALPRSSLPLSWLNGVRKIIILQYNSLDRKMTGRPHRRKAHDLTAADPKFESRTFFNCRSVLTYLFVLWINICYTYLVFKWLSELPILTSSL